MKKPFFSLIIASLFLLTACNSKEEVVSEIPAPNVQVLDLSKKPDYQVTEVGQIKAEQEVELIARATGTIGQQSVKIGEAVKAGQVLAVIDFDESNNPARLNYDNAQNQLANARQTYSEVVANNQSQITQSQLRMKTLETTLGRLQRNLNELLVTNKSTQTTLNLQLENAKKNEDTAEVNYTKIVAQFEQSWIDLLKSNQTSLNSIFINLTTSFSSLEGIINPKRYTYFTGGSMESGLGDRSSIQRNDVVNTYNSLRSNLPRYESNYESYLPLNDVGITSAFSEARKAADAMRVFVSQVRSLLQNSIARGDLTQAQIDAYITQVGVIEGSVISQTASVDALEKALASFKLDRASQIATADNNRIIASNQLADSNNGLIQFRTSSFGSVQDLEAQITQTSNDILSAQADLSSSYRSSGISTSGKNLEINTLENQLRLAEKSLTDNQVISSINGVLSEFVVDAGNYVSMGTYLGKVIQHERVKVVFYASKENAARLTLGQSFTFSVDGNGHEMKGIINKIAPSADPINKKMRIEGAIQNDDFVLKPETYINLKLDLSTETFDDSKVYVPMNSIIFAQNAQYVYVSENSIAVRKDVQIGDVFGAWVEITDGLDKTDLLIIEGQRNLPPLGGVKINVIQ